MKDIAEGMTYLGLPVHIPLPGAGTHGIFTTACRVRGVEQLCLDMVEDPDFAHQFLAIITDKTIERILAWHGLAETGGELPSAGGWGMGDDSLQLISTEMCERFVLPHHERIYAAMTKGAGRIHLCGYAQQHFQTLYDSLGVTTLDGPGPFVDHGALLTDMPDLSIIAQANHSTTLNGPESEIEDMMRSMLTETSEQPGRFYITGFLFRDAPPAHVDAMYQAGKRYGRTRS